MDNQYDVPDSTDWLGTPLAGLATLENLLHCQICKEFYDTPMITSCAHTFCSKCIRTSLSADGKCPVCTQTDQAIKLRNNWAVQEIVTSFIATRPQALAVARATHDAVESSLQPGKRKRALVADSDDTLDTEEGVRRTRSKSRRIAASQSSQQEPIEVEDSDGGSTFEPEAPATDGLVECPLGCGRRMKIEAVEPHLDKCEDEKRQACKPRVGIASGPFGRTTDLSVNTKPRPQERINELHYSGMKEQALTKKLKELGIPTWGSKQVMTNRHREWVNIWNANCDSNQPRSKTDLLRDLDIWERTQGGSAPAQNRLTAGVMRKDFDGGAYSRKHQDDFSRLIADARRRKVSSTTTDPTQQDSATDNATNLPDPITKANPEAMITSVDSMISPVHQLGTVDTSVSEMQATDGQLSQIPLHNHEPPKPVSDT